MSKVTHEGRRKVTDGEEVAKTGKFYKITQSKTDSRRPQWKSYYLEKIPFRLCELSS